LQRPTEVLRRRHHHLLGSLDKGSPFLVLDDLERTSRRERMKVDVMHGHHFVLQLLIVFQVVDPQPNTPGISL
jgi:hypothetical protein